MNQKSYNRNWAKPFRAVLKKHKIEMLDLDGAITCPGRHLHTTPTRIRDCVMFCSRGGMRAHCFHQSCAQSVGEFNRDLARVLHGDNWVDFVSEAVCKGSNLADKKVRTKPVCPEVKRAIFKDFEWRYEEIAADSPEPITDEPCHHWRYLLSLFSPEEIIWIGKDVQDSGPNFQRRFRSCAEWEMERTCPGRFICPNTFKRGSYSRSGTNILERKFLVVESDTLGRDQVGAVFRWLQEMMGMKLRAVVDTAGKSLHAWFESPNPKLMNELKRILPELGCDPALFQASQPCRLPGGLRAGRYQTLLYLSK